MNTNLITIPHSSQAYPTVGDWRKGEQGDVQIRVSYMANDDYEFLVALHELIEQKLCEKRGITTAMVDRFDKRFEKKRKVGDESEPGDHPKAPYRAEHFFATSIERLMAAELGVDWSKYDATVNAL